jgi:cytochrome c biogenesis protein CcdA
MGGIGLALIAGILSTLSPCVLPLVPIVIGAATGAHRFGPAALAAGLSLSFVLIGLFVAAIGFSAGLDQGLFRSAAAAVLIVVGGVLLMPQLQARIAVAAGPLGNWAQAQASGYSDRGLGGQFAVGFLLGAVWSPCVGPTLGAAIGLASSTGAGSIARAAASMFAFGVGSALPLLATAYASRRMLAARNVLLSAGSNGKLWLGGVLVAMGLMVLLGADKQIEAAVLARLPQWWIDLIAGA